jgi:hypothetical protein
MNALETPISRVGAAYLKAAYVVLTVWPLIHMLLSFAVDFSPWKFMGWGMYATPYPDFRQVVAFKKPLDCRRPDLLAQGVPRPRIIEEGPVLAFSVFAFYDWRLRGVTRVPILLPPNDFAQFFMELRRFYVLNTEASFERALRRVDHYEPALLGVVSPRISLERKLLYWDLSLYRYENQRVRLVSRYEAGDVDPLMRIGRELDCL